jgi:phenylpropionate dioxygenase-like ring-hydroxylating dioxygenase large terminal subunit
MFIHQSQLRHLLRPEHYTSAEFYGREVDRLFRPAWHPLAAAAELPRPGDYRTYDLFGTPVLLRNCDGEVRAFLNVCPHRHSQLVVEPKGHSDRFKCRYHGWEFDKDGRTGRIPEARVFRPWDRENSCLRVFRTDRCGDLLFVCLDDHAPSLREWVGPLWDVWATYGFPYRHAGTWEKAFPCNWKVVLENSLESYHIPEIHPKTFKYAPEEEIVTHELDPRFSAFHTTPHEEFAVKAERWLVRRLGGTVTNEYVHRVLHPHATGSMMDSWRMMQCVYPTGPTTCVYRCIFFVLGHPRPGPVRWALHRLLRSIALYVGRKVFDEDGSIYEGVQRGLAASPHRGVIGTREERIYMFQRYVLDRCGGDAPADRTPLPVAADGDGTCHPA